MSETPDTSRQEIKLFYCYAHEDKALRDELQVNLAGLRRRYRLTDWYDREILPGEPWEETIDKHLSTADVILLLISPHFVNSDYCYGKEMQRALERHHACSCYIIPILLRPTYWEDTPLSSIQMLPTNAKPITSWPDRYEAFHDVARGIGTTIQTLLNSRKTKEQWMNEGNALSNLKRYEEALAAYDQAIRLDSNNASYYNYKGGTLRELKRYEEALAACEQTIRLDPDLAAAYFGKGIVLRELKRYEEALAAYDQGIRLDPDLAAAYDSKGSVLRELKRFREALAACEQAIRLDPKNKVYYNNKGAALGGLKRPQEALTAFKQAIHLDPNYVAAYIGKGTVLRELKRDEEALTAYEQAIRLNPKIAFAYKGKGICLRILGRGKEAQQAFDKADQLGYNN